MSLKFLVVSTLLSLVLAVNISSQSCAQISYQGTSFESIAVAETDAGEEYSYIINNAEPVGSDGIYMFDETGSAPGYYSSASVGVTHDSTLTSTGLHLIGKAYGYVSDDVGYAACSASSEALGYVTFRLRSARRVTISGVLSLSGTSQPQSFSNLFELRRSNGTLVTSSSGTGPIAYTGRLTAGTYTVYVGSQVLRQINGSGGDVYEGSTASYDVTLTSR